MKTFLTLLFVTFAFHSFAQKKQNIYYLNDKDQIVASADSSTYVRIIEEPDSGDTNFPLKEFNRDSTKRRFGAVSSFSPTLIFEGPVVEFYKNGKRKTVQNYVKNSLIGAAFYFYPNGKLKEQRDYLAEPILESSKKVSNPLGKPRKSAFQESQQQQQVFGSTERKIYYKTIQYADSSGTFFLDKDGTGNIKDDTDSTDKIEGSYLNGLRNGLWKERVTNDSITYLEIFDHGSFISGKAVKDNGTVKEYDVFESPPAFKGGLDNFYKFLANNLKFPRAAQDNRVNGKVFLSFVIDKDGSVKDVKVVRGIGYGCDEEAVRTIDISPKWIPGFQRGSPVRVKYSVAINFNVL